MITTKLIRMPVVLALHLALASVCLGQVEPTALYTSPTSAELDTAEQMFTALFSMKSLELARRSAASLGLSWREDETGISLLDEHKSGWGEYRFSKETSGGLSLQAPHRYHDRHTGSIALQLYSAGEINSVALNTLPRGTRVNHIAGLKADFARLPDSLHIVYARAFASTYPKGKLIQLHGFSAAKRRSEAGRSAQYILSTGSVSASAWLLDAQECLSTAGWKALRYPHEVRELGGTTNSIGRLLRNLGHSGFHHIEMNSQVRDELAGAPGKLHTLSNCLRGGDQ